MMWRAGTLLIFCAGTSIAGVLPEERADALYHYYDGGGVEIDGPSLLVRKSVNDKVSLSAGYYVDSISSASIDVVTTASPYSEERKQWSAGADYLHEDTTLSFGYVTSDENDYNAETLNFGISQDIFNGLTTISLGYVSGSDDVSKRGDPVFSEQIKRHAYRLGITQILTRNTLMSFNYEAIADEGYLNNPYRQVRYVDSSLPAGYGWQGEVYPDTRASNAAAVSLRYHLPYRAAVSGTYRFFTDDWGIDAQTIDVGYVQPWRDRWLFDVRYRYYSQNAADFYADLFPYADAQNYMGRDKELSKFQSYGPHVAVSYTWLDRAGDRPLRSTVNFVLDYYTYSYDDFRDVEDGGTVGAEPLYDFDANVVQLFISLWF